MSFRNRVSSRYNDFVNGLRSNYLWDFNRRREDEESSDNSTTDTGTKPNTVDKVHFYIKDNAKLHHTKAFDFIHDEVPKPILRRGQPAYLAIRFKDRDFDLKTDKVILNFRFGARPSVNKGTMGVIRVTNKTFTKTKDDWDVRIDPGTNGKDLVLQFYIPASVPVGIWKLHVRTGLHDGDNTAVFKADSDIFILFNPWSKDDAVYMEDEGKREEYVMGDQGKVYVGSHKTPRGRPWAFGQFDDVVLPVACYILELSRFPAAERGNPVQVVRAISAGVNNNNDDGILVGRWDGEYSDGVAPYKWTGSVRILEEYMKAGFQPVRYGQCWVYSALVNTICRALGIPCRSVSNFVSAHDTNSSLTIDTFFDKDSNKLEYDPFSDSKDSIWNFHVWNDVWMSRTDLPPGYGGWQAIDATPQEASDNMMQCGPASLVAINRGDIGLGYDCTFVFSEVNADVMHWIEDPQSDWGYSRLKTNNFHVGRKIMTKKAGEDDDSGERDAENIITEYKNKEGTPAERLAIHNAIRGSRRAQQYYEYDSNIKEDVEFDMIDIDAIQIGDDFKIKVLFRNTSNQPRTIIAALHASSVYYTGTHHSVIKKAGGTIKIGPKEEKDIALTVQYKEYWKKLQEQCMIKIYTICRVEETKQTWTEEDDFQVEKPKLAIEVPSKVKRMEPCETLFSFTNPLDEELTNCEISIDGSGLLRPRKIKLPDDVPANGKFIYPFKFRPRVHGNRKLVVSFNSKELFDINGSKKIVVAKP